ncbi:MAG: hypothetical protein LUE27_07785 [Clostridia bacterium]|nr:hypothetical protein [Clostridia bacterium]
MANVTVYPDWVQAQRRKGTTVKKKGDAYYLYKRTSKRVPGKKYPQPVDTYLGIITPEGVVETQKKRVSLSDVQVMEYGFSQTILQLCPQSWKDPLGDDWEDILLIIISKLSPETYLSKIRDIKSENDFPHYQFAAQIAGLFRRMQNERGVKRDDLEQLKTIYMVRFKEGCVISQVSEKQQSFLDEMAIRLGEYE